MLIVRSRNPNNAERELIEKLKDLDGVAFIGYIVAHGEKEREIDALVFTPVRAAVIEVKAPQIGSPSEGELTPYLNAPWLIGGEQAKFYGGPHPNTQARINAQIFAHFLKDQNLEATPFIQSAVLVAGDDLTMSKGPKMLGQTVAGLVRDTVEALDKMKQKPIDLPMVLSIIDALDLGPLTPSREAIEREWANAEEAHKAIPKPKPSKEIVSVAKKVIAPYPPEQDKSAFQRWISKVSDYAAIFVAIFLLVFFLDNTGAVDLAREFPQQIWQYVTSDGQHSISNDPRVPPLNPPNDDSSGLLP